jgi:hypothetical protein
MPALKRLAPGEEKTPMSLEHSSTHESHEEPSGQPQFVGRLALVLLVLVVLFALLAIFAGTRFHPVI